MIGTLIFYFGIFAIRNIYLYILICSLWSKFNIVQNKPELQSIYLLTYENI